MSLVGYARVSTIDQSLDIQIQQLKDAGCERIFCEKLSGKDTSRPELHKCLDWVRDGDILIVTRLDRLARSIIDLRKIISMLEGKQTGFRCIHQPMDTTTSEGRLMLNVLGAFAEFEMDIRKERQREGIAAAKAAGKYKRDPRITPEKIRRVRELHPTFGARQVAEKLGCTQPTVYKMTPGEWGERPKNLTHNAKPKVTIDDIVGTTVEGMRPEKRRGLLGAFLGGTDGR